MDLNSRYSYYDILEINPHCPQHDVTSAYERAKATYSGENPAIYTMFNEDEARNLLRLIEEAYSVLGNKTLRSLYDEKIGQKIPTAELSFESLQNESKITFSPPVRKNTSNKVDYKLNESFEAELKKTNEWNGPFLKKVREYKNYSLDSMSVITKISSYYLRAIEDMDPKNLPAPVYVRGYVAQIAKVLGVDEKKVCDSYMKSFKSALEAR